MVETIQQVRNKWHGAPCRVCCPMRHCGTTTYQENTSEGKFVCCRGCAWRAPMLQPGTALCAMLPPTWRQRNRLRRCLPTKHYLIYSGLFCSILLQEYVGAQWLAQKAGYLMHTI